MLLQHFVILSISPLYILLIIIVIAGVIGLVSYLIYCFLSLRLKDKNDDKPTEDEVVDQELKRILMPVEDEKIAKEIENYDEDEQEQKDKTTKSE